MRRSTFGLIAIALFVGLVVATSAWSYHSYLLSVQQLQAGLAKAQTPAGKGFVLVDVRSPEEHRTGMIPGTDMNIDFREIKSRHRELGAQPDDHIVVYCQSGHRSNIAAETLAEADGGTAGVPEGERRQPRGARHTDSRVHACVYI